MESLRFPITVLIRVPSQDLFFPETSKISTVNVKHSEKKYKNKKMGKKESTTNIHTAPHITYMHYGMISIQIYKALHGKQ